LNELAELCQDSDAVVRQLAILSSVEVYKDILPGYRIRLLTPAEQSQKVSGCIVWAYDVFLLSLNHTVWDLQS
jgi:hypothetical protein